MTNLRPLDEARNPDLPASYEALKRAALRAREIARQTGTALVIGENGEVRLIPCGQEQGDAVLHEPGASYGDEA